MQHKTILTQNSYICDRKHSELIKIGLFQGILSKNSLAREDNSLILKYLEEWVIRSQSEPFSTQLLWSLWVQIPLLITDCWDLGPQVCSDLPTNWEQTGAVNDSLGTHISQSTDKDRLAILTNIKHERMMRMVTLYHIAFSLTWWETFFYYSSSLYSVRPKYKLFNLLYDLLGQGRFQNLYSGICR